MKNVIVLYDDSRKPCKEICRITGDKSFGQMILKRRTILDRMHESCMKSSRVICVAALADAGYVLEKFAKEVAGIVLLYTDFAFHDAESLNVLFEKSVYAHEAYCVKSNQKVAAVLFPDVQTFLTTPADSFASLAEISFENLTDLNEIGAFRDFITGGFDARFFNSVKGDEYTVVKSSESVEKLRKEFTFWSLLPDAMKQWFVMPFDFKESTDEKGNAVASYAMERMNMPDLAIRYVHEAFSADEFRDICTKLFHFISVRARKTVTFDEYEVQAKKLYIDKLDERIALLKQQKEYESLTHWIAVGTEYSDIDAIVNRYKQLYESVRSSKKFVPIAVVGHGDLCFSNILFNREASVMKLIDPRGALCEEDLYMDPYYDLAKLSHSILGNYDFFNSDLFDIVMDSDMKLHVVTENTSGCGNIFAEFLQKNDIDIRLIRLYETSLFLSMLPLHIDRPKKVLGFVLNAIAIMDDIERL